MIAENLIIDFHGHVGRWDSLGLLDDPAGMLRAMDACGIDKSCRFRIYLRSNLCVCPGSFLENNTIFEFFQSVSCTRGGIN